MTVKFLTEGLSAASTSDTVSDLFVTLLGAFAEFERNIILERQREGIAVAKAKGRYRGGQPEAVSRPDCRAAGVSRCRGERRRPGLGLQS
jgi:resolvase protein